MYDLIQSALTAAAEFIAIAGITLIIAHAVYTQHCKFMSEFCPPVAPNPSAITQSKAVSRKLPQSKTGELPFFIPSYET
jgi:hypothetical protein